MTRVANRPKAGVAIKSSSAGPLSPADLRRIDAYWRASNYLAVGQIYLLDNPLLKEHIRRNEM